MASMLGAILTLLTLASGVSAVPYQCTELKTVIPSCSCEARILNGLEINSDVIINCRNLNFNTVPVINGASSHVIYEMTLAQNNIQTIPASAFRRLKIERLDLRDNRLTNFNNDSFEGLENYLKELYLDAENGAGIQVPIGSLLNLNALTSLHLEYFTYPSNRLMKGSLNLLTRLTSLTMRHNNLTFIQSLAFPLSLQSLTLDHQGLTSFPSDVFKSLTQLERLTVTNTVIPALYLKSLEINTRLQYLDLSHNNINLLQTGCFVGITNSLLTLSLQSNPFDSVADLSEIKELRVLTELHLAGITMTELTTAPVFLSRGSLTVLNLENTGLTTLGPSVFSVLNKLEELNLADNPLVNMGNDALTGLPNLTDLDLSRCSGSTQLTLPTSLTSLPLLATLKLTRSKISLATLWARISPIVSLQFLHLDGLSISSIPNYAFRNLTQLKELDLANNDLTEVTQEMLAGPRNLSKVMLTNNKITTVSKCAFHGYLLPPPLTMDLTTNPLACDCNLRWLLEHRAANKIELSELEVCASPADKTNTLLKDLQPADLSCRIQPTETPCLDLYPEPEASTTPPSSSLALTVIETTTTSITVQWTVTNPAGISYFQIRHMDLETSTTVLIDNIDKADRSYEMTGLKEDMVYSVCITAFGSSSDRDCLNQKTNSTGTTDKQQDEGDSSEIGIIVGVIVGVVVLAAIIGLIVYLVCIRRRCSKDLPEQPHEFKPSELPAMTSHSRQFNKPKDKNQPRVGRALDDIKVTVISDGQTTPGTSQGRHSAGSYQFLDEKHLNPNPHIVPQHSGTYNNDMGSRQLPSAPDNSFPGYYKHMGPQPANTYNEIE